MAISWLYLKLLFQSDAIFEAIDKKTIDACKKTLSWCKQTDFHNKGFALSRVSKVTFLNSVMAYYLFVYLALKVITSRALPETLATQAIRSTRR